MTTISVNVMDDEEGRIISEMADRQLRTPEALLMLAFGYYINIEKAFISGARVDIHYKDGSIQEFRAL